MSRAPFIQLTDEEQKAQAKRCPCMGIDDYCVCQNMPDRETRRLRAAKRVVDVIMACEES